MTNHLNHARASEQGKQKQPQKGLVVALAPFAGYALYRSWLAITQYERLLFAEPAQNAISMMGIHISTSLAFALACAIIWVAWRKRGDRMSDVPLIYWGAGAAFTIGTVVSAVGGSGEFAGEFARAGRICGGVLTGIGSAFAFVMWGELFSTLSQKWVRAFSLMQLIVPIPFLFLVFAPYAACFAVFVSLPVLAFATLWAARKSALKDVRGATSAKRANRIKPNAQVVAGVAIICAGYGFLQTLLTVNNVRPILLAQMVLAAFVLAFLIAYAVFGRTDDPDYRRAMRTVTSILVMGYLLFPLVSNDAVRFVGNTLIISGFILFEYVIIVALSDAASHAEQSPTAIFAAARAIVTGSLVAGMLVSVALWCAVPDFQSSNTARSIIVAVSVMLMSTAGIWLLSENNLHRFFWGGGSGAGGKEQLGEAVAKIARIHNLTNRERDVLELWIQGRSVPYIQENLVISNNTVSTHVRHIYQKCGVHSRQELLDLVQ